MKLLTNDLYEGAWLLSKGMELSNLWMEANGRRTVVFEFVGASIDGLKEEYKRGKAHANVYQLKVAMSELRDRMYALIREKSQTSPSSGGNGNGTGHHPHLSSPLKGEEVQRLRQGGKYARACEAT